MSFNGKIPLLAGAVVLALVRSAVAQDVFIAGIHPDRRPENAPRITEFSKSADWTERAMHGISEPYPSSLGFLADQGAWFTPFNHPGMTDRYDIRNWHHDD
ncbi:hypothetical protein CSC94_23545 [Zhengella mangrovi]|uniref:Uncharacterized protein n=1 Tax=Zhengella mangrovi TaxID=1982044 RepID=A0A2G1QH70_9HYPH|nr:hypothetical protein [Zhengella mangrovi]PHP64588.1 hypothetical protein CSC94_23545 [Zhengella mangrovi]